MILNWKFRIHTINDEFLLYTMTDITWLYKVKFIFSEISGMNYEFLKKKKAKLTNPGTEKGIWTLINKQ